MNALISIAIIAGGSWIITKSISDYLGREIAKRRRKK